MAAKEVYVGSMIDGTPPPIWELPEAASQTFKAGDLVYRVNGLVTVCGADPSQILGVVMEDGHNTTASLYNVKVAIATEATLFMMNVYHSSGTYNMIEVTDAGKLYEIVVSSNIWSVDKTATSNTRIRIQKFVDPLGTVLGRVLVSILPAYREVS